MLLALFFECFSYAQVFDFDGINYIITSEEDRTASVYRSNVREEVIIPSVVTYHDTDYKVTCIGDNAFNSCYELTSITIPESVISIGDYAFYGCSSLSYLSLPSTLEEFGNNCFNECEGLQTAGPKGGGYNYEFCWEDVIPANAFYELNYLKSVYIPKTVKSVYECDKVTGIGYPSSVFYGCNNLESVTVSFKDTKLMRLWRSSFIDVWDWQVYPMNYYLYEMNPIRSLTFLDDTITTLSSILTDSIKEIVISKDVKFINPMAFDYPPYYFENGSNFNFAFNADNITVENDNPNYSSIDGILFNKQGDELLVYPAGRSWCYIPESTKTIARSAFKRSKITNVSIPSNVEHIGESAFEGCDSIKWISFEGSPEIGLYAFWDCPNIESVTANNEVPGKMNTSDTPQTIMVEASYDENDESLTIRPYYNQELGRMISRISSYLQNWSCSLLSDAVIPGENKVVIGILRNTEDNMPNLFSVKIEALLTDSSVTTLFTGRKGSRLQTWTAGNNNYDTIPITTINVPEDCKAIRITLSTVSRNGYTNDMWLDRVFLSPDGKGLPIEAYCGPFTKEVFNNAMLYVPDGAVNDYSAADGWNLFKNIKTDYQTTFNIDGIIYKINQNDNNSVTVTDYSNDTKDIVIPSVVSYNDILYGVTEIGNSAFAHCTQLKSITIPASVYCIGDGAFYECDSLEWVSFEGSPRICSDAFYGCNNISSISSLSHNPGIMELARYRQTFLVGDTTDFYLNANNNQDLKIKHFFHPELGEWVSELTSPMYGWQCNLKSDAVIPGTYRFLIVILPNSDGRPSLFHPIIYGVKDDQLETIYNPTSKIGRIEYPTTFSNDITADYEFIEIADSLTIPTGYDYIVIGIQSRVNSTNVDKYSNRINLYRFYFVECYDETEAFSGPFTENVFNNAMLYVPDGAVDTYRAADGWKLFKNICIDDAVDPITLDKTNEFKDRIIYDTMGRKVETESIEQLAPGLYIIGGSTFLIE